MKYNIRINQKAASDNKLNVDIIDLAIFDLLHSFSISPDCKKMFENGNQYFLFSWKLVTQQMPILKLTTRQSVINRYNRLKDANVIIAHSDNQKLNQSWFCFGSNASKLLFSSEESLQPVNESLQPCKVSFTPPVNNCLHNNIHNDNSNKNNNYIQSDFENRKKQFYNEIIELKESNPDKYPSILYTKFFNYWTETNKKKTIMRFERETFFELSKRLSTFWGNCSDAQKQFFWNKHFENGNNQTSTTKDTAEK